MAVISQSDFGALIDGSIENLERHLSIRTLGYARSLLILVETTYNQLVSLKDEYIAKANSSEYKEEKRCLDEQIKKVYAELFKLEEKATFLVKYVASKSSLNKENSDLTN